MSFGSRVRAAAAVLVLATLCACASLNPLASADTVEQRAFAVRGMYVVAREQLADLVVPSSPLSADIQRLLLSREEALDGVMDSFTATFLRYVEIRDAYESGATPRARLVAVMRDLDDAITTATDLVIHFRSMIEEARN